MSSYKLIETIIEESVSKEWNEAVLEWSILSINEDEEATSECICGHNGIRYCYEIKNIKNGVTLYPIGSECIKRFGREDLKEKMPIMEKILQLKNAFAKNIVVELKSDFFSRKLLEYFYEENVFEANQWNDHNPKKDYKFLLNNFNGRGVISTKENSKIRVLIDKNIKKYCKNYEYCR